ncbi:Eukaryotic translation initiation factor 2 alpha subunit family protein [Trichomonas vaginalis G3]|uniref:Eukaryotic translation initiation factor 2 alpha subunit family protein n=1 Tax=Trichomonas vaginalis (strain ATCC PRA-98 / G3) TaxID=412133 RepID=A2E7K3_TRIV3|nr:negative regulation of translational initiation in response to stress [Trichomonas vaginalis G3]EAY11396.1 Eukaryotic translation initiation factor 2 alpha subunit family protein [Trichomonas vaginalis G3]KAI5530561.1 negative regulation of translational initiation in response to stress [Trichomonas vaginalis G3]|eukprot:XP_001323619.1 Eukaryotic translation initiation factor 2 alpha subunit family protein [Trichomonas vaginalis G3]
MATPNIHSVNWYPNDLPNPSDKVMVKITRVDELGIWVQLLEYSNREGMIPLGQFTTRKSRKVPKTIRVGKVDTAMVTTVDVEKGNMDLTRQGLKEEEIAANEKRYNDYKNLMNLLAFASTQCKVPLEELVQTIAHPLTKEYGNAYQALQQSNTKPEILDDLQISAEVKESIRTQIQRMFTPQELRIHSTFEAEVLTKAGVDALREALVAGYEAAPDSSLSISVIAPPVYSAALNTLGAEQGIEILNKCLEIIEEKITAVGGRFNIKEAPKAISQKEAQLLQQQMEEMGNDANANDDLDEMERQGPE